ncbi:DUF2809 domain-containing protein [Bacteroidota bacterium]
MQIRSKRILQYCFYIVLCGVFGFLSRKFDQKLPDIIVLYAGDTLWAVAAYFLIRIYTSTLRRWKTAFFAYIFSMLIEFSQLYHANWINTIRNTILGGLALGFGFQWDDLICYLLGVVIAWIIDSFIY